MDKKADTSSLRKITANKLLNNGGKDIVIHKSNYNQNKTTKSIINGNDDRKYKKYLNKYWICKRCTFWNINSNKKCMVCSMVGISNNNQKNSFKLSLKNGMKTNGTKSKGSWANMAKNGKSKPLKQPKQKKKYQFGWICVQCTFENKAAHQKCAMCDGPKPKKS